MRLSLGRNAIRMSGHAGAHSQSRLRLQRHAAVAGGMENVDFVWSRALE
jgi:hypothetical protein